MDIGECGVCGRWASGRRFPSGNRRRDGTTPMDNFVCYRCQEEVRDSSAAYDRQAERRSGIAVLFIVNSKNACGKLAR